MKPSKTNAMRLLDQKKIDYALRDYSDTDAVSALEVAAVFEEDPARLFKTLVTEAKPGEYVVFLVPGDKELDLKKAATAVGKKSIHMIKSSELLAVTGYVHGGCSPIGMKKSFPTFLHETASDFDTIFISAGAIGLQLELSLRELEKILGFTLEDLTLE